MMSDQEFSKWCAAIGLTPEAIDLLHLIRTSPPSRCSQGQTNNVRGKYSSVKMGHTIGFDSHRCELACIFDLEHDPEVLEYWPQPPPIRVSFVCNGKRLVIWYTADFAVLSRTRAYYIECKPEESLERKAQKMPGYFVKGDDGVWRCPPVEEALSAKGIGFMVWVPEKQPVYTRNMNFLQDYCIQPWPVPEEIANEVTRIVTKEGRSRLSDLPSKVPGLTHDHLNQMILDGKIFVDLYQDVLSLRSKVWVFKDRNAGQLLGAAYQCIGEPPPHYGPVPIEEKVGAWVKWEEKVCRIKLLTEKTIYLQHGEKVVDLTRVDFDRYASNGTIQGTTSNGEHPVVAEIKSALAATHEDKVSFMLEKLAALDGGKTTFSARTMRRVKKAARIAKEETGSAIYGLVPKHFSKGNRHPRLPEALYVIADEVIEDAYGTATAPSKLSAHALFKKKCKEKSLDPASYNWFAARCDTKDRREMTESREGRRKAYCRFGFNYRLRRDCPVHGDHPWDVGHIDHTQLDIVAALKGGGRRPWLTTFWLSYPRKLVAYYVHFDPPSKVAVMSVIRLCLMRYGRLPTWLVVDNGAEFHGADFQLLVFSKGSNIKYRPPHHARYGSTLESAFHALNANLIHNLEGNAKVMKNVRQVTKSILPANLARWSLVEIEQKIAAYYDIVNDMVHPSLDGATPNQYYDEGMKLLGARTHLFKPFDDEQYILTLPRVDRDRKLSPQGIKFHYFRYTNSALENLPEKHVPVRYDPLDIRFIYALVKGVWICCTCPLLAGLAARSEAQLGLATVAIRANTTGVMRKRGTDMAMRVLHLLEQMPPPLTSPSAEAAKPPVAPEPIKVPNLPTVPFVPDLAVPEKDPKPTDTLSEENEGDDSSFEILPTVDT